MDVEMAHVYSVGVQVVSHILPAFGGAQDYLKQIFKETSQCEIRFTTRLQFANLQIFYESGGCTGVKFFIFTDDDAFLRKMLCRGEKITNFVF
jgi:hypothetical protein